jgi:hypothetical protein
MTVNGSTLSVAAGEMVYGVAWVNTGTGSVADSGYTFSTSLGCLNGATGGACTNVQLYPYWGNAPLAGSTSITATVNSRKWNLATITVH